MDTLLIKGYSAFELGIFNEKDLKVEIIKKAVRRALIGYLENGLQWLVFTGSLGFEYWALEVAKDLQEDYDFQIATMFDFETHGQNWNESNQIKLSAFKNVDFVKYAFKDYESPQQFRFYQDFLLENTEGAFVFYDEENETKLQFFVDKMKKTADYPVDFLRFEDLQELADEISN